MLSTGKDIKLNNFRVMRRFAYEFTGELYFSRIDFLREPDIYAILVVIGMRDEFAWEDFDFNPQKGRLTIKMKSAASAYYHCGNVYILTKKPSRFGDRMWYNDVNHFINENIFVEGNNRVVLVWKDESLDEAEKDDSWYVINNDNIVTICNEVTQFMLANGLTDPPEIIVNEDGRSYLTWRNQPIRRIHDPNHRLNLDEWLN